MARTNDVPQEYDPQVFRGIMSDYDRQLDSLSRVVGRYSITGFTRTTTLDMGTATATDIGNFLCTVIEDMQKAKRLGGG